jgi:glutamyl-tRNA synthetase
MPPGPSKYLHVGHAVSFGINWLYAQQYNGKCILRFDDTNPEVEKEEFVTAIQDDVIGYMGMKPSKIVFASDFMDTFYTYAEQLIKDAQVYACNCSSEEMSKQRRSMKECPHRNQTPAEVKQIWEDMKAGTAQEYTLRLRIDMKHKNAVMRDPVVYRVIAASHYRQKETYKVWPMYDLESPVMDGLLGITHVMRSNEFDTRIELHHYVAKLFGFSEIPYKHYGRINIVGATTKGREIRDGIDSGKYIGWDDPRLVTLQALKRRGIVRETLHTIAKTAGMSKQNTNIDFSVLAAENRKLLDASASRFFFVKEPVEIEIHLAPTLKGDLDLHPDAKKGGRAFLTTEKFYIEKSDLKNIKEGELVRLIDRLNFRKKGKVFIFDSLEYEKFKNKGKQIIQWLPAEMNVEAIILMPNGKKQIGLAETNVTSLQKGDVIQFQRFGFCRLDSKKPLMFWYTHD